LLFLFLFMFAWWIASKANTQVVLKTVIQLKT